MTSRFIREQPLTIERLKDFVGLDNLTAQTPLIETSRSGVVKIWTAYDVTRTLGTYTQVDRNGCVRTVTIYPSYRKEETINKPAYKAKSTLKKHERLGFV